MVATIFAAVGSDRSHDRRSLAGWHQAGLVVGALALTTALAVTGSALPLPAAIAGVVAVPMLAWGVAAVAGRPLPVRSPARQVPLAWRYTMSPRQYAFSYGVGLGLAVATRVASVSLYALLAVVMLDGRFTTAVTAALAYSVARGAPVVYATTASDAEDAMRRLEGIRAVAVSADGLALAAAGVVLLTSAVGSL